MSRARVIGVGRQVSIIVVRSAHNSHEGKRQDQAGEYYDA